VSRDENCFESLKNQISTVCTCAGGENVWISVHYCSKVEVVSFLYTVLGVDLKQPSLKIGNTKKEELINLVSMSERQALFCIFFSTKKKNKQRIILHFFNAHSKKYLSRNAIPLNAILYVLRVLKGLLVECVRTEWAIPEAEFMNVQNY
jgi:hypothetical protein